MIQETLNARSHYSSSDDDGAAVHRINQYIIKQEIGRGSFGAVHLAVDQYGVEYVRAAHLSCTNTLSHSWSELMVRQGCQRVFQSASQEASAVQPPATTQSEETEWAFGSQNRL